MGTIAFFAFLKDRIRNEIINLIINWIKKKEKTFNPYWLYDFALSNRNRTISEKLLDKPVLGQGCPVNISQADLMG
jgi:hypothetical protein